MKKDLLSKLTVSATVAVLAGMAVVSAAQAATELTVYTAVEAEDLKKYAKAFNKTNPDIKIKWVRDSTGVEDGWVSWNVEPCFPDRLPAAIQCAQDSGAAGSLVGYEHDMFAGAVNVGERNRGESPTIHDDRGVPGDHAAARSRPSDTGQP